MQRQAAGKVPFRFRKAAKAIWRNEQASEENDASANEEPHEEPEEGLEGDGDSEAPQDLDNGQGAPSLPQIQPQGLSDSAQAGQTNETSVEDRRSPSGPAGQEPSHDEVSGPDDPI